MLDPDNRVTLSDQLTPPSGYRLGHAVATSFTLDLTAMLQVPLGFAGHDLTSTADPLTLMQAIRNAADRVDVFCQAGEIAVPAKPNPLIEYLSTSVHAVAPSAGRLFHPKVWLVRYDPIDGNEAAHFRMLCGSRNLTHDRSWDAVVTLDGVATRRRRAVNRPLAEFVEELPARAATPMDPQRTTAIAELAESVRTVEWRSPEGAPDVDDWLAFHLFGNDRRPTVDLDGYRQLVISPFLSDDGLDEVLGGARGKPGTAVILSRPESFDALSDESREWLVDRRVQLLTLDPAASIEDDDGDLDVNVDEDGAPAAASGVVRWALRGLHAKIYVVERARRAHVFIGSANATGAAWRRNDEALVEVVGQVSRLGVDALVGDNSAFRKLLEVHEFGDAPREDPVEQLELLLQNQLHDLAALRITARVLPPDGQSRDRWGEQLETAEPVSLSSAAQDAGVTLHVALATAPQLTQSAAHGEPMSISFELEGMEQITPFVVLTLTAQHDGRPVSVSTMTLGDLVGDPEERLDLLLARYITSPEMFRRLLMMLLDLADDPSMFDSGAGGAFATWRTGASGEGLLERFALTLAGNSSAIDDVARVVDRLVRTEEGRALLPPGWDAVWPEVVAARRRIGADR